MRLRGSQNAGDTVAGRRGTIGLLNPFEEGDEESRRAAHMALLRKRRVLAARAKREWTEIRRERLERRGRYYVNADTGRVYEPVRAGA
jgi:hypothetical protein